MAVTPGERSPRGAGLDSAAATVLTAAAVAVAAELVVQRILVRIGIHIPAFPFLRGPYTVVTESGSIAFPAAVLLAGAALAVTLWWLRERLPGRAGAVLLVTVPLFPLAGVALGLGGREAGWELQMALLYLLAAGIAGAALVAAARGRAKVFAAVLTLSLVTGAAAGLPQVASGGHSAELARAGEGGMLVAALLALGLLASRTIDRRAVLIASAAGASMLMLQVANPSTTNIVLLWGLGLTGSLPFLLYCGAVGAVAYAVERLWSDGRILTALGLAFVVMGGYGLHNTYQSTVQILGLCVLLAAQLEDEVRRAPAAAEAGQSQRGARSRSRGAAPALAE